MKISPERLGYETKLTGFRAEILEKVIHLLNLLNLFSQDPLLKDSLVLSGGTALNLFIFDVPRLSVDIDMNYIGRVDVEGMKEERPSIEDTVTKIVKSEGFTVDFKPEHHAGGKWQLRYESALGGSRELQIDIDFLLRVPLWSIQYIKPKYSIEDVNPVPVLDLHELAAGKLAALFSRTTCRDVFDSHLLLNSDLLTMDKLRLAFIIYGGFNRDNWLDKTPDMLSLPDKHQFINEIHPMLRGEYSAGFENRYKWAENLLDDLNDRCKNLVDYTESERNYLTALINDGEIIPSLLTSDVELIKRIESHPAIQWKAMNVRKFKGGKS